MKVSDKEERIYRPRRRRWIYFSGAIVLGLIVYLFAPPWLEHVARIVGAYDVAALALLAILWIYGVEHDPKLTQSRAAVADPGRNVDLGIVLACVAAGLVSAVAILGREPHVRTLNEKLLIYGLGLTAITVGWALIHTLFLFRYAHLYYYDINDDQQADRGLAFPGTEDPSDDDFAYFSFVIGMTFQVSDVSITTRALRRLALTHALISFGYNTAIVALVINLLSGLFR